MKDLKPFQKIVLVHAAIAFLVALYYTVAEGGDGFADFAFGFGIVCLLSGIADVAISLILFIASSRIWGKGFLLSAGILLLLSGISCGLAAGFY